MQRREDGVRDNWRSVRDKACSVWLCTIVHGEQVGEFAHVKPSRLVTECVA
jgi:hypothetical protein